MRYEKVCPNSSHKTRVTGWMSFSPWEFTKGAHTCSVIPDGGLSQVANPPFRLIGHILVANNYPMLAQPESPEQIFFREVVVYSADHHYHETSQSLAKPLVGPCGVARRSSTHPHGIPRLRDISRVVQPGIQHLILAEDPLRRPAGWHESIQSTPAFSPS